MPHPRQLDTGDSPRIGSQRLVKRSRALRGRNPARDSQAHGASKAPAPLRLGNGAFSSPLGTPETCLKKSLGLGQSPSIYPQILLKNLDNRVVENTIIQGKEAFFMR